MKFKNTLDIPVFQDELDFKTLENILECLDHVIPKKVSRAEYNALKGDFLVETGEDKFGKRYDLFLPEDLVHGELLHIIDFLSRKFGLKNYTPYSRIITKTKVMIGVILRGFGENEGEKYLQELAQKYNLSQEFVARLQAQKDGGEKIKFSEAKKIIGKIKQKRTDNNEKIGENPDDIILGLDELKDLFGEEFELTFLRKGVNMLRLGMMTITQAEQRALKKRGVGIGEKISLHVSDEILDENERLLRDKIGIDALKKELEEIRRTGDQEEINKTIYQICNTILEALYEYPYQMTYQHNGSQPSKIIKSKEIYCVGYCLLGHAFLSELSIEHDYIFDFDHHIALGIVIGNEKYYFDGTWGPDIYDFTSLDKHTYEEITFNNGVKICAQTSNSIQVLLAGVYNNINKGSINLDNLTEAKHLINKAIKFNPKNPLYYLNKSRTVNKKAAEMNLLVYQLLLGHKFKIPRRDKTKQRIIQLIDAKNFEGLRLYLLELEKQETN